MLPISDDNPTRRPPYLTWLLLVANVLAFAYQASLGQREGALLVSDWGFVPARFVASPLGEVVTAFTAMFMHGGLAHLGSNMLFLWLFGDNVEDRVGRLPYLALYFGAGLCAAAAQLLIDPASTVPMIGASGAISGVVGAYLLFYPRAPVTVVGPFFFLLQLPAWLVIAEWFVLQLMGAFTSLFVPGGGGVAYFAHLGGFATGLLLALSLRDEQPPPLPPRRVYFMPPPDDPYLGWRPPRHHR